MVACVNNECTFFFKMNIKELFSLLWAATTVHAMYSVIKTQSNPNFFLTHLQHLWRREGEQSTVCVSKWNYLLLQPKMGFTFFNVQKKVFILFGSFKLVILLSNVKTNK